MCSYLTIYTCQIQRGSAYSFSTLNDAQEDEQSQILPCKSALRDDGKEGANIVDGDQGLLLPRPKLVLATEDKQEQAHSSSSLPSVQVHSKVFFFFCLSPPSSIPDLPPDDGLLRLLSQRRRDFQRRHDQRF